MEKVEFGKVTFGKGMRQISSVPTYGVMNKGYYLIVTEDC